MVHISAKMTDQVPRPCYWVVVEIAGVVIICSSSARRCLVIGYESSTRVCFAFVFQQSRKPGELQIPLLWDMICLEHSGKYGLTYVARQYPRVIIIILILSFVTHERESQLHQIPRRAVGA